MTVLITYGTKMGGTAGLADMLGKAFTTAGLDVEVRPVLEVEQVERFDAVIVGSALYMGHWRRDARRFVKRNADALRDRPVVFFSSGPLDDSATTQPIPPTKQVRRLMDRVGSTEHMTFGGKLDQDATGFPAHAMVKEHAGDWRDQSQVTAWAHHIIGYLDGLPAERFSRTTRTGDRPTPS